MIRHWKLGVVACLAICGVAVIGGRYVPKLIKKHEFTQLARTLQVRAEEGDAKAQSELASMLYYGKGVPQNYGEAARWYRRAADQGNTMAIVATGTIYYYGKGVPQDYAEAARWYRKAADQGDTKSEFYLGSVYYGGKGVPQSYAEAARWYRKAADQGDAMAQVDLGFMYEQGKGVQQDYTEALRWYRKAAYQEDAKAEYNIGCMYYYGQGLPQNYTDAIRWYRKAADHGYPDAQRILRSIEKQSSISKAIRYVVALVSFLAGLVLILEVLWHRKWHRAKYPVTLGVIALFYAGLSLYAITHDGMRYSTCRNVFYLAQGVLIGMAAIVGATIIFSKRSGVSNSRKAGK